MIPPMSTEVTGSTDDALFEALDASAENALRWCLVVASSPHQRHSSSDCDYDVNCGSAGTDVITSVVVTVNVGGGGVNFGGTTSVINISPFGYCSLLLHAVTASPLALLP